MLSCCKAGCQLYVDDLINGKYMLVCFHAGKNDSKFKKKRDRRESCLRKARLGKDDDILIEVTLEVLW